MKAKTKKKVIIHHTNERGAMYAVKGHKDGWEWAVIDLDKSDGEGGFYWLAAFPSKAKAKAWCKERGYIN